MKQPITRKGWTPADLDLLRVMYPHSRTADIAAVLGCGLSRIYCAATSLGLRKSPEFLASDMAGRIQRGQHHPAMVATRFKPGHSSWNTGVKGWSAPGTEATRFKPGSSPPNRQEVGALRINSDGQLDIKLYDGLRAWVQMSHYSWFLAHGEWPARGICLRFKDGDCHNTAISNLQAVTRQENMRLNSVHTKYPPEVARLVQLRGALNRQINRSTKQSSQAAGAPA